MTEPALTLTLLVPGAWEPVPDGVTELRRYLSDEFGATLTVRTSKSLLPIPIRLYAGPWPTSADDEIKRRIEAAFFNLDWLEMEDVG
jgi:hypothetical protein